LTQIITDEKTMTKGRREGEKERKGYPPSHRLSLSPSLYLSILPVFIRVYPCPFFTVNKKLNVLVTACVVLFTSFT
jgi:hypothetical protein